jgi:putative DNA methylase
MTEWGDLFSARQKLAMVGLIEITRDLGKKSKAYEALALALSRSANALCSLCRWHVSGEKHEGVYSRQALPIVWDFSEANPLSEATGSYSGATDWVADVAETVVFSSAGTVQCSDACEAPLPDDAAAVWFTDPPYYDAVPYADLSDFFFVWLGRALPDNTLLRDPFDATNPLTPKTREIVQDETKRFDGRTKGRAFFEERMAVAFAEGRRVLNDDGIGSVVFAHKTTEGWEALLNGMVSGGWTITGSWPVATEMGARLRARESAALATSVHLVCRPRAEDAEIGDWGEIFKELPNRIGDWIERLSTEGVRGADLVFACIGPAMELYSRYSKVEDAEGREIPLGGDPEAVEPYKRGFLAYVWETVGRIALEQILGTAEARARNGAAGALEEDARLTALFLWTIQSTATTNGAGAESDGKTKVRMKMKIPTRANQRKDSPSSMTLRAASRSRWEFIWTDGRIGSSSSRRESCGCSRSWSAPSSCSARTVRSERRI